MARDPRTGFPGTTATGRKASRYHETVLPSALLAMAHRIESRVPWSARTRSPAAGRSPGTSCRSRPWSASHYEARDLSALSPECQAILGFCRDWRSVAEISAVLRMPLGVARVLVADMAVEGLVRIHQTDHEHGRPDLNLLERVLSGLRKL